MYSKKERQQTLAMLQEARKAAVVQTLAQFINIEAVSENDTEMTTLAGFSGKTILSNITGVRDAMPEHVATILAGAIGDAYDDLKVAEGGAGERMRFAFAALEMMKSTLIEATVYGRLKSELQAPPELGDLADEINALLTIPMLEKVHIFLAAFLLPKIVQDGGMKKEIMDSILGVLDDCYATKTPEQVDKTLAMGIANVIKEEVGEFAEFASSQESELDDIFAKTGIKRPE